MSARSWVLYLLACLFFAFLMNIIFDHVWPTKVKMPILADTAFHVRSDTLGLLDLHFPYRGKREDTIMVEIKLCKVRDTCQWFFKCFVMMPRDKGAIGAGDLTLGQLP